MVGLVHGPGQLEVRTEKGRRRGGGGISKRESEEVYKTGGRTFQPPAGGRVTRNGGKGGNQKGAHSGNRQIKGTSVFQGVPLVF